MISKGRNLLLLFSLVAAVLLVACSQQRQPCLEPTNISVRAGIYTTNIDTAGVASIVSYALPSPVWGIIDSLGNSTFLYFNTNTSFFRFTLSSLSDECRWIIRPDTLANTITDTLTFSYSRQLTFVSNGCGYRYYYTLNNVNTTHNNIDSVITNKTEVNNDLNAEHIRIYFIKRVDIPPFPSVTHGPYPTI